MLAHPAGYDDVGRKKWVRKNLKYSAGMTEPAQRKAIEKALALFVADVERRQIVSTKRITVRDLADRWMQEHVTPNLSPVSADSYRTFLEGRILPALGNVNYTN